MPSSGYKQIMSKLEKKNQAKINVYGHYQQKRMRENEGAAVLIRTISTRCSSMCL